MKEEDGSYVVRQAASTTATVMDEQHNGVHIKVR